MDESNKINKKLIINDIDTMSITKKMDINKLNKTELLNKCKELGLKKYASKNKSQLVGLITEIITNSNTIISESPVNEPLPINNEILETNVDLLVILKKLLEKYSIKNLAESLNLAPGTLTRWMELKDIPKSYEFDLLKLSGIKIDYSKYSSKQKDQFFTPVKTAQYCFELFCEEIKKFNENESEFQFIEPSAGDNSFIKILPNDRTIALDIEPKHENIIEKDYLDWKPDSDGRYAVFGNPPFGLRGHTALKFINHSFEFAEYVCFILPQLFESDGKGVPRKRVKGFNLIYSKKLETSFYEPNNNELKINTIFQIWSKNHTNEAFDIKDYTNEKMRIYSLSDGGTIASTRNKDMIGKCDVYIPSTCFGKENMKCYNSFDELPGKKGYGIVFNVSKETMMEKMININWSDIAFLSTNSAYNLRSSQIYSLFDV